jgi:hypothetical protein
MTKNDLYAYLTRQGLRRGFEVIPEFTIDLPNDAGTRNIDLVWATRKQNHRGPQHKRNSSYWQLRGAFEIEGCNISMNPQNHRAIVRHIEAFGTIRTDYGLAKTKHLVALYTAAYDRYWHAGIYPEEEDERRRAIREEKALARRTQQVTDRVVWGRANQVPVVDGREITTEIAVRFPVRRAKKKAPSESQTSKRWRGGRSR